jgi:hypothetical protein
MTELQERALGLLPFQTRSPIKHDRERLACFDRLAKQELRSIAGELSITLGELICERGWVRKVG